MTESRVPSPEFRGPKLVEFDRRRLLRFYAKKFVKQICKPGVRNVTFIIEREDGINIQTSHRDEMEIISIMERTAATMRQW